MIALSSQQKAGMPAHGCKGHMASLVVVLLAGALSLGITSAAAAPNPGVGCFFAEPLTGRRVTSYEVELATGREQRSSFSVPRDCQELIQTADGGSAYTGSVIDRRLWHKVESDCRYHAFLNHHPLDLSLIHI